MRRLFTVVFMLAFSGTALAGDAWWHQVPANTANNDGSITLLDANGNPLNMVANPTAAMVKPNQAAVTQPPTVIVQATTGYWKDPVVGWGNLPATGNQVGDTRMVTSLGRAFSWSGTAWQPLAADQNGTMRTNDFQATNVVAEGTGCPENGRQARDGTGAPLFCQSGVWTLPSTFHAFVTTQSVVDAACTGGTDPNPPGYNYAVWAITCGSRFCATGQYKFGMVTESPGTDPNRPFESDPGGMVTVSCSK